MRGRDGHFFTDEALDCWVKELTASGADLRAMSALYLLPLLQREYGLSYGNARVALECLRDRARALSQIACDCG